MNGCYIIGTFELDKFQVVVFHFCLTFRLSVQMSIISVFTIVDINNKWIQETHTDWKYERKYERRAWHKRQKWLKPNMMIVRRKQSKLYIKIIISKVHFAEFCNGSQTYHYILLVLKYGCNNWQRFGRFVKVCSARTYFLRILSVTQKCYTKWLIAGLLWYHRWWERTRDSWKNHQIRWKQRKWLRIQRKSLKNRSKKKIILHSKSKVHDYLPLEREGCMWIRTVLAESVKNNCTCEIFLYNFEFWHIWEKSFSNFYDFGENLRKF